MTSKGRILVVDDDRLVLATVAHGLAQAGYEVVDADNGDDAILLAREHRPMLALLDIRMEGLSGFDVAEYLRDVAHVPFIFLSAFTDAETRAKVAELGALAYLVKPLDVGQIVPTVDRAVAGLRGLPADGVEANDVAAVAGTPATAQARPADGETVSLALGILMHRYSLTRQQARDRLQRQAADKGLSLTAQADRLVAAVEELAGPGAG
jgi:response regulator NasT